MARKRQRRSANGLIGLPWWFSAMLAIGTFLALRWILPGLLPSGPFLESLRPALASVSWIALCAFGGTALFAALRARLECRGRARQAAAAGDPLRREPTSATDSAMPSIPAKPPLAWTLEALRSLEWKRFELLCARYYEAAGFATETLAAGPDGGIDVKLYKNDPAMPLAVVQCKAWNTRPVGVKEIRELLGVMAHGRVGRGIFVTTGGFSADALAFGAASPIQLLDGPAFVDKLCKLPQARQDALLTFAFAGDYHTPSCPSCGIKLVARTSKRGAFWGCCNYPRCKTLIPSSTS